jgi:hypothetical protein
MFNLQTSTEARLAEGRYDYSLTNLVNQSFSLVNKSSGKVVCINLVEFVGGVSSAGGKQGIGDFHRDLIRKLDQIHHTFHQNDALTFLPALLLDIKLVV